MADRILSLLKANRDKLQEQYDANAESIATVQEACLSSVLPHLRAELDLGEHEAAWAEEWLRDEGASPIIMLALYMSSKLTMKPVRFLDNQNPYSVLLFL